MRRLRQMQTRLAQALCSYRGHGTLYIGRNELTMFCPHCGWQSSGLGLDTTRVRMLWMHERQRLRWRARTKLQRTAC